MNSDSYIIAYEFRQKMHREMLFAKPLYQTKCATCLYAFFLQFGKKADVLLVFILVVQTLLWLYSVAWVGAVS